MRIRHVGLGQARTCDENGFSVSTCGKEIVIQANKTKKLELSLVHDLTLYVYMHICMAYVYATLHVDVKYYR